MVNVSRESGPLSVMGQDLQAVARRDVLPLDRLGDNHTDVRDRPGGELLYLRNGGEDAGRRPDAQLLPQARPSPGALESGGSVDWSRSHLCELAVAGQLLYESPADGVKPSRPTLERLRYPQLRAFLLTWIE